MSGIKEVIRVLGFIQEYFDNHADEQEPNERKELFVDWSDTVLEAITLLKAQEPVKPPIIKENSYGWKFYYCPSCGKEFYQNNKFSFCEKCGQAVKWE